MATGLHVQHDFRKNTVQTILGDEPPMYRASIAHSVANRAEIRTAYGSYFIPAVLTVRSAEGG
jgi:hypothetical protein